MQFILKEIRNECNIYYDDRCDSSKPLVELFFNNEYKELKVLQKKIDRDVSLIEIKGKKYVLKRENGRGIIDILLGSKARMMFRNIKKLKAKGFENIYDVKMVIERKKGFKISETLFLSDYIEGTLPNTLSDYEEIMSLLSELHFLGHYHGDTKPENFIKTSKGIVLIDTKLRKASFAKIGIYKDVVRLQKKTEEVLELDKYFKNYKKHFSYYLAIFIIYRRDLSKGFHFLKEFI